MDERDERWQQQQLESSSISLSGPLAPHELTPDFYDATMQGDYDQQSDEAGAAEPSDPADPHTPPRDAASSSSSFSGPLAPHELPYGFHDAMMQSLDNQQSDEADAAELGDPADRHTQPRDAASSSSSNHNHAPPHDPAAGGYPPHASSTHAQPPPCDPFAGGYPPHAFNTHAPPRHDFAAGGYLPHAFDTHAPSPRDSACGGYSPQMSNTHTSPPRGSAHASYSSHTLHNHHAPPHNAGGSQAPFWACDSDHGSYPPHGEANSGNDHYGAFNDHVPLSFELADADMMLEAPPDISVQSSYASYRSDADQGRMNAQPSDAYWDQAYSSSSNGLLYGSGNEFDRSSSYEADQVYDGDESSMQRQSLSGLQQFDPAYGSQQHPHATHSDQPYTSSSEYDRVSAHSAGARSGHTYGGDDRMNAQYPFGPQGDVQQSDASYALHAPLAPVSVLEALLAVEQQRVLGSKLERASTSSMTGVKLDLLNTIASVIKEDKQQPVLDSEPMTAWVTNVDARLIGLVNVYDSDSNVEVPAELVATSTAKCCAVRANKFFLLYQLTQRVDRLDVVPGNVDFNGICAPRVFDVFHDVTKRAVFIRLLTQTLAKLASMNPINFTVQNVCIEADAVVYMDAWLNTTAKLCSKSTVQFLNETDATRYHKRHNEATQRVKDEMAADEALQHAAVTKDELFRSTMTRNAVTDSANANKQKTDAERAAYCDSADGIKDRMRMAQMREERAESAACTAKCSIMEHFQNARRSSSSTFVVDSAAGVASSSTLAEYSKSTQVSVFLYVLERVAMEFKSCNHDTPAQKEMQLEPITTLAWQMLYNVRVMGQPLMLCQVVGQWLPGADRRARCYGLADFLAARKVAQAVLARCDPATGGADSPAATPSARASGGEFGSAVDTCARMFRLAQILDVGALAQVAELMHHVLKQHRVHLALIDGRFYIPWVDSAATLMEGADALPKKGRKK